MIAALSWPDSTPGHDRGGAALADDRVHPRVAGGDGAEQLRHQPAGGGADHADAGVARHVVVERGDVGGDVVDLVQDPPGPLDDPLALVGEAAVGAVDQGDAELAFELGDVPGDVGLHGVQRPGGGGERAVIGDGDDGGELTDVHVAEPNRHHRKNRYFVSLSSTCQMHSVIVHTFTRQERSEKTPHLPLGGIPTNRSPTEGFPRLRRPDPPSGRFPFSRCGPRLFRESRLAWPRA